MSKLRFLLTTIVALGAVGNASAFEVKGTPYNFTGSVISASAACPYKAKAQLAGYTLLKKNYTYVYKPPNSYSDVFSGYKGPVLIFSPGVGVEKSVMKIDNLPKNSGTISGQARILLLPNIGTIKGTYKGTISIKPNGIFTLNYTSTFPNKNAICTTTYDLSFAIGVPTKLLDLL
jgi:hypothetical protein